jgi:L-lactate utilization protein LutC
MSFEEDKDYTDKYYEKYTERFKSKIKKQERKLKDSSKQKMNESQNQLLGGRKNKRKITPKDEKFETLLKKVLKK